MDLRLPRSRLALWLTLGLLADLALLFTFSWGDQVLLHPSLRRAEPWAILACAGAGFLVALVLHGRAIADRASRGIPRPSRLRSALILCFGGMVGMAVALTALRSLPLVGHRAERTVTVLPAVIDGGMSGRSGCAHVMILDEDPTAPICISSVQMHHAQSWPEAHRLRLELSGWGNRFAIFYTDVSLLGPAPGTEG